VPFLQVDGQLLDGVNDVHPLDDAAEDNVPEVEVRNDAPSESLRCRLEGLAQGDCENEGKSEGEGMI